ncbi:MAG: sigma-70 family RNA polymerase sigma factor [Planctomycetota bacterium]
MIDSSSSENPGRIAEGTFPGNETFDSLFRIFHPRLLRFLTKQLEGTSIDPEDVAQESMVKVWTKRDQFDNRYQLSTWVYSIARNTATDHLRKRRYAESLDRDSVVANDHETDDGVAIAEQFSAVWKVAGEVLSKDQYSAMWLRYGEEMTIKEVSKALSKTTVSVRVLLHRARNIIQRQLVERGLASERGGHDESEVLEP